MMPGRWTVVTAVLFLTLTACSSSSESGGDDIVATPTPQVDADGDGYTADLDCNDQDASIHPDATEVCDQVDNNCNSQTDEGFPSQTYYPDQDGDGYGDDQGATVSCAAPDGYVGRGDDCDDTDAAINPSAIEVVCNGVDENCSGPGDDHPDQDGDGYDICSADVAGSDGLEVDCDDTDGNTYPGATESCDEKDNDCDGDVDEDLVLNTYYRDADADLHGDPDATIEACAPPAGYVAVGDDCNDSDGTVFPGAPEEYGDDVDSNCNGHKDYIVAVSAWEGVVEDGGYGGDGGDVSGAAFNHPTGMVMDRQGNIYVADTGNHVVREISADGFVTTLAGTGDAGLADTYGSSAQFDSPTALAIDSTGNTLYIADTGNNRIRAYDFRTEYVTTVVGDGETEYQEESGWATDAHLNAPQGVAFKTPNSLLISDTGNHVIREAGPFGTLDRTPTIETIAGTGNQGYNGDSISPTWADLDGPTGIVVDSTGTIFFSDTGNQLLREIANGTIGRIAGSQGEAGADESDEGGGSYNAILNNPTALVMNTSRLILVFDTGNNRIRQIYPCDAGGRCILTIAGSADLDPGNFVEEGEVATAVPLSAPQGGALAPDGTLWISDTGHNVIRQLIP